MSIELNGTTGITSPNLTGDGSGLTSLTSANLTGALPAISGSSLTSLTSANLTGALPAIDGSALTGVGASTAFDAVGTYMFGEAYSSSGGGSLASGATRSSSLLYATNFQGVSYGSTGVSGTWRLMGGPTNGDVGGGRRSIWVRIS